MTKADQLLPNWQIDVTEVSAGIYKVVAMHTAGPSIEMTGTDENKLIEDVRITAREMEQRIASREHSSWKA